MINRTINDLKYWRKHLLRFEKKGMRPQMQLAEAMINHYLDKLSFERRLVGPDKA